MTRWVAGEVLFWVCYAIGLWSFAFTVETLRIKYMEPEFTVRSYDLGNKPKPEAEFRYRVRLYEGGQVIKEWETEKHPYISDSGFVYVDGVNVISGTILIEEVKP